MVYQGFVEQELEHQINLLELTASEAVKQSFYRGICEGILAVTGDKHPLHFVVIAELGEFISLNKEYSDVSDIVNNGN